MHLNGELQKACERIFTPLQQINYTCISQTFGIFLL